MKKLILYFVLIDFIISYSPPLLDTTTLISKLEPENSDLLEIFNNRIPIIFKNSLPSNWDISKESLSKFITQTCRISSPDRKNTNIKQRKKDLNNNIFLYCDTEKEEILFKNEEDLKNCPVNSEQILCSRLLSFIENDKDHYLYYSREINKEKTEKYLPLPDWSKIKPDSSLHLWIGNSNVTAQIHYDLADNLYFQLYGQKKFLISSPKFLSQLFLFPFFHPSSRQSQIDWEIFPEINFEKFPNSDFPDTFEIILEQGDILYLPPFWSHRVIAFSPLSISFNIWFEIAESDFFLSLMKLPLPLETFWKFEEKKENLNLFFDSLLEDLKIKKKDFCENFYEKMYKPSLDINNFNCDTNSKDDECFNILENEKISTYLEPISQTFKNQIFPQVLNSKLDQKDKEMVILIWIGKYIEKVSYFLLKDDLISWFTCFCS